MKNTKRLIALLLTGTLLLILCACSSGKTDSYGNDEIYAFVIAQDIVSGRLKSPSTASFCWKSDATITCSGTTWTVKGWVDAQNGFGATIRSNFTVKFDTTGKDTYTYKVISCSIS